MYRASIPCLSLCEVYHASTPCLSLGEAAEHSEDGEGIEKGCKTLSVTCGDSSPKGRAKGLHSAA